ncbi:glycosyltransferase family 4 protein [Anaerohalosphaera lusitana]|nr:glycosyltransferase family 4 protein [Anaerohalosphaera lusitana]
MGPSLKIVFVSSFKPRKCGIASFTSDLISSTKMLQGERFFPEVIALESDGEFQYDKPVTLRLRKNAEYHYVYAADYVNMSDVDMVCIQHEYGLFGGEAGSHLSIFLERVKKPVITTLHTILDKPDVKQFELLKEICGRSDKVVVMSYRGATLLKELYRVPARKIIHIPHGIPDFPFSESTSWKRELNLGDRRIITTFGLLSPNKGIEIMLKALTTIIKTDPSVLYMVLGTVHPEIVRREGYTLQTDLAKKAKQLGVAGHVAFYNRFVSDRELLTFLGATDVYVSPYLHPEQVSSGTLAFAIGFGKAVVSTPFYAAQELLADGRGKLVDFGNSEELADTVIDIITHPGKLWDMRRRAYAYGREMRWSKVSRAYWDLFLSCLENRTESYNIVTTDETRLPFLPHNARNKGP